MNKKDMARVLAILQTNYQKKIENSEAVVNVWLMTLGDFSNEAVMESALLHMRNSKFFPTPSEIKDNIVRHKIVLQSSAPPALISGKRKVTKVPEGMTEEEFFDSIIQHQIELETLMEQSGFLKFER